MIALEEGCKFDPTARLLVQPRHFMCKERVDVAAKRVLYLTQEGTPLRSVFPHVAACRYRSMWSHSSRAR